MRRPRQQPGSVSRHFKLSQNIEPERYPYSVVLTKGGAPFSPRNHIWFLFTIEVGRCRDVLNERCDEIEDYMLEGHPVVFALEARQDVDVLWPRMRTFLRRGYRSPPGDNNSWRGFSSLAVRATDDLSKVVALTREHLRKIAPLARRAQAENASGNFDQAHSTLEAIARLAEICDGLTVERQRRKPGSVAQTAGGAP
jgi:hypothetical protein